MKVIMDNGGTKTHTVNNKAQISHGIEQKTELYNKKGGKIEKRQIRAVGEKERSGKSDDVRASPYASSRKAEHYTKQSAGKGNKKGAVKEASTEKPETRRSSQTVRGAKTDTTHTKADKHIPSPAARKVKQYQKRKKQNKIKSERAAKAEASKVSQTKQSIKADKSAPSPDLRKAKQYQHRTTQSKNKSASKSPQTKQSIKAAKSATSPDLRKVKQYQQRATQSKTKSASKSPQTEQSIKADKSAPSLDLRKAKHYKQRAAQKKSAKSVNIAKPEASKLQHSGAAKDLKAERKQVQQISDKEIPTKGKRFASPQELERRRAKFADKRKRLEPKKQYKVLENGVVGKKKLTKKKDKRLYSKQDTKLKNIKLKKIPSKTFKIPRSKSELIKETVIAKKKRDYFSKKPIPLKPTQVSKPPKQAKVPIQQKQKAPIQQKQKTPIQQKQKMPIQQKQKTPIQQEQKAPIRQKQKAPIRQKQKAPIRQKQKTLIRKKSKEPLQQKPKAPIRQKQKVPIRQKQKAPIQQKPKAPIRQKQKMPIQQKPKAPIRQKPNVPKPKKPKVPKVNRNQAELISMEMGAGLASAPKKHHITQAIGKAGKVKNVAKKPVELVKQEFYRQADKSDDNGVKAVKLGVQSAEYGKRGVQTAAEKGIKTAKKGSKIVKRVYRKLHKTTSAEMRRTIRKRILRNKIKTQVDYAAKQAVKKGVQTAGKAAANTAKKAAQSAYKAAQATARAVTAAVVKVASLIAETMPWSLIIIGAVLLILLIALMFGSMISGAAGSVAGGGSWLVDDNIAQTPEEIFEGYENYIVQANEVMERQAKQALESAVTAFCESDTAEPHKIISYTDKDNSRFFYPANGADEAINELIEEFTTNDYAEYLSLLFVLMTREKQQADGQNDDTIYDFDFKTEDFEEFMKTVNENGCRYGATFVIKTAQVTSGNPCPGESCRTKTIPGCQCGSVTDTEGHIHHFCKGHPYCPHNHDKMTVMLYSVKDYYNKDYPEIYNFTDNEKIRYEASRAIIQSMLDYWEVH